MSFFLNYKKNWILQKVLSFSSLDWSGTLWNYMKHKFKRTYGCDVIISTNVNLQIKLGFLLALAPPCHPASVTLNFLYFECLHCIFLQVRLIVLYITRSEIIVAILFGCAVHAMDEIGIVYNKHILIMTCFWKSLFGCESKS